MARPECDNDMNHHHARVSCQDDQIRHARDRIGGLRSRQVPVEGIDLIIHHQQYGAPGSMCISSDMGFSLQMC
jgi:hypothetical protein